MDTNALSQMAFVMLVQCKFDSANERTNYMNLGRERTSARTPQIASERKEKADSTLRSSQAVPHPSTDRALRCLTSEVKRDPVHSTRYGRRRHETFPMTLLIAK